MKNILCYEITKDPSDYRLSIIREGYCKTFFDGGYAETDDGKLKCYVDVSGYNPVRSYVEIPVRAAIGILIATLKGIMAAVDNYMLPWDYLVSTKTVYADRSGENVRFVYIPAYAEKESLKNRGFVSRVMGRFCSELEKLVCIEERASFSEVKAVFDEPCFKASDCLRKLYLLKRDMRSSLDL